MKVSREVDATRPHFRENVSVRSMASEDYRVQWVSRPYEGVSQVRPSVKARRVDDDHHLLVRVVWQPCHLAQRGGLHNASRPDKPGAPAHDDGNGEHLAPI